MTGAEVIIKCLIEQNVDTVFGYPGYSILSIYDALNANKDKIRHILPSNEQHAIHAADGFARATGKTGVVIATSGPGVTNLITGIAAAFMDSSPLVIITGNVPNSMLGTDAFQEIDTSGITMPITKYNLIINDTKNIQKGIRKAFRIAQKGRKGPVLIDIPRDVLEAKCEFSELKEAETEEKTEINELDLSTAAALINEAVSPVILAGGGVCASQAQKELSEFANKINAPVFTTFMGKVAFSYKERLFAGIMGGETDADAKKLIDDADLVIAIGTRFTERTTASFKNLNKSTRILHIDIDPAEIDKNVSADLYIIGDAKDVLKKILPLTDAKSNAPQVPEIKVHRKHTFEHRLFEILGNIFSDAVFTTDVGTHQVLAVRYLKTDKIRGFITSGGLGAMGFGLGAAIGAAIGTNAATVNISGDGSFHMNMPELSTIQKYDLPVFNVILNNEKLGLVRDLQANEFGNEYQTRGEFRTDYKALAAAFGLGYLRITNRNLTEDIIKKFREKHKNGIIEFLI